MKQTHVVIIGAGPAGLTAAYELLRQPEAYRVTILEEDTRIGGISKTVAHGGNRIDIGGHRFFSKDDRVTAWWENMLPMQGHPAFDERVLSRAARLTPGFSSARSRASSFSISTPRRRSRQIPRQRSAIMEKTPSQSTPYWMWA